MADYEIRSLEASEIRAETENGKPIVRGYAAKFGKQSKDLGGFKEVIVPTAFDEALADKSSDVVALFNHSINHVLGRRSAGTLELSKDEVGLAYKIILPDTTTGRDLQVSMARGDVGKSSFQFKVKPGGASWSSDGSLRTLKNVELRDVSVVTNPAYEDTPVELSKRSAEAAESEATKPLTAEDRADGPDAGGKPHDYHKNQVGISFVEQLIRDGHVSDDNWTFDANDQDKILGTPPNWGNYAKYFLKVDKNEPADTKAHYKYPAAKLVNNHPVVFKSKVANIIARATQEKLPEFAELATKLLAQINEKQTEKNSAPDDAIATMIELGALTVIEKFAHLASYLQVIFGAAATLASAVLGWLGVRKMLDVHHCWREKRRAKKRHDDFFRRTKE